MTVSYLFNVMNFAAVPNILEPVTALSHVFKARLAALMSLSQIPFEKVTISFTPPGCWLPKAVDVLQQSLVEITMQDELVVKHAGCKVLVLPILLSSDKTDISAHQSMHPIQAHFLLSQTCDLPAPSMNEPIVVSFIPIIDKNEMADGTGAGYFASVQRMLLQGAYRSLLEQPYTYDGKVVSFNQSSARGIVHFLSKEVQSISQRI
ncbi:hypothetical protein BC828DRAFT_264775 [Blastocladiella britannica]|nr:hypothetical protein BC828DRAFT_264775 [Blastocladiella britannica]